MGDEIRPAMTPDEWKTWRQEGHVTRDGRMILHSKGIGFAGVPRISAYMMPMDTETHACAAACLYGHPFGFTREDAEFLSWCGNYAENPGWVTHEKASRLHVIAAKLAALLPPA